MVTKYFTKFHPLSNIDAYLRISQGYRRNRLTPVQWLHISTFVQRL